MLRLSRQLAIVIRHSLNTFLSLAIFIGGIFIFLSRIPGWSLFLGLIFIPIGAVFIIFNIDEVARKIFAPPEYKMTKCSVCQKITFAKEREKNAICGYCREEEIDQLLKEGVLKS